MPSDSPAAEDPDSRFGRPERLFFGVGAQKSGITWLHRYLDAHPEVFVSRKKELHYWDVVRPPHDRARAAKLQRRLRRRRLVPDRLRPGRLFGLAPRRLSEESLSACAAMYRGSDAGHETYATALFSGYAGQPVAGEITPAYALLGADTFAEMGALAADVRFLFLMRDPVDRLVSGIAHKLRKRGGTDRVSPTSLGDHLAAALRDPCDGGILRSRYDRTIRTLEQAVAKDRIGYFFYETMFSEPEIDRLCRFLAVGYRPARTRERVNGGRVGKPELPETLLKEARRVLAPAYEFCAQRFGTLPEGWHAEGEREAA